MTSSELREKRRLLGLTQPELAQRIGVSKGTIINYEKGNTAIPDSKKKILEIVFGEEEERKYKMESILELLHPNLRKSAEKMPNPREYVLQFLLDRINPTEVIDFIDRHKEAYFHLEEFKILAKNVIGLDEIDLLKHEISKIKRTLDKISQSQ